MIRLPFTASDEWIDACLAQSGEFAVTTDAPLHDHLFDWLVPLLNHGSILEEDRYLGELKRLLKREWTPSVMPCATFGKLTTIMDRNMGFHPRLREGGVVIATANAFTREFLPPAASRAKAATNYLLRTSYPILADRDAVGPALATYLALLTIHPLVDGNGRVARRYFAGCVAKCQDASALILGLVLLHQRSAAGFHLASRIARMGDMTAVLERFADSVESVPRIFGEDLAEASSALREDDQRAVLAALLRIRSRASLYLSD